MNVLFLITARGGSKGVPKKNVKELGGRTLLEYKVISALKTDCNKRIILSTDSEEIAELGIKYGAEVPFVRPDELATDKASSVDVIDHAMKWVEKNDDTVYDLIFLLEPSSPFGTFVDFNKAINLFDSDNVENVVGVGQTHPHSTFIVPISEDGSIKEFGARIKNLKKLYRQNFPNEYTPNGTLYVSRWDAFKKNKTFYTDKTFPIIQDEFYSIEIDSIHDFMYAEFVVEKGLVDNKFWI